MKTSEQEYTHWRKHLEDQPQYMKELADIQDDPEEIEDRFGRSLVFGTGGMRGVMGLGTNRINTYTIGQASQGLADYLSDQNTDIKVAIAYDSRECSKEFAWETASILARAGITVFIYKELMPTPALSYAVREYGCNAGVVITASHNPAKFNGYKVYGNDGSQIKPDVADAITACIQAVDIFTGIRQMEHSDALACGRIRLIPDSFFYQYIEQVFDQMIDCAACMNTGLVVAYTPLNGAGKRCVCEALNEAGITDIHIVPQQEHPDGKFTTCPEPNPEEKDALELGLALSHKVKADVLLATDPDADRLAVAVRHFGNYRILTGNEVGVLLLDYICKARKDNGLMPESPVAVRSIVSAQLADQVAEAHGVEMRVVPTGFKYVGEVIQELEITGDERRFIFGFEESCGYLAGNYVRDKDAVAAALLVAEMVCVYKKQKKTLVDVLCEIRQRFDAPDNYAKAIEFKGPGAVERINTAMAGLRATQPKRIGKSSIDCWIDYSAGICHPDRGNPAVPFPPANLLECYLDNGCSIILRPSGTEAKLKAYYSIPHLPETEIHSLLPNHSSNGSPHNAASKELFAYYHSHVLDLIQRSVIAEKE